MAADTSGQTADGLPGDRPATALEITLLVTVLLLTFIAVTYLMLRFWPACSHDGSVQPNFLGITLCGASDENRWFILVMAAGALGSFIHAANSAGDFIGSRKLVSSWIYWYLLRLPIGASLALLVYLLLRGGVLTGIPIPVGTDTQPFGVVGLSALAGMFAKQATNKLGEVFETLFKTRKDAELTDKMTAAIPVLSKVEPDLLQARGEPAATIKLYGKNFNSTSRVLVAGASRTPLFVSATELVLTLQAADLATERILELQVTAPDVGDAASNIIGLEIRAAGKSETRG